MRDGGGPRVDVGRQQIGLADEGIDEAALAGLDLADDRDPAGLLLKPSKLLADERIGARVDQDPIELLAAPDELRAARLDGFADPPAVPRQSAADCPSGRVTVNGGEALLGRPQSLTERKSDRGVRHVVPHECWSKQRSGATETCRARPVHHSASLAKSSCLRQSSAPTSLQFHGRTPRSSVLTRSECLGVDGGQTAELLNNGG